MRAVWQWIWTQNFEGVARAGYDDLNPSHVSLFRYPTLDNSRMTDIAQRMDITKQSVHELIGHLEDCGYVVREPDPADRRARIVRLTPKGHAVENVIREQARNAEKQIASILGQRRFTQVQESLGILIAHIAMNERDG